MLSLFAFGGRFELAQLRHGGSGRVFAFLVLLPPLGLGGVVILSHLVSCLVLGSIALIRAIATVPVRCSIVN